MTVPRITHLQFYVLAALLRQPLAGRAVRARLREAKVRQSAPGFYQMMSTLEDSGYVSGWYEQQVLEGQIIRERHYKILAAGRRAWCDSRDFYLGVIDEVGEEPALG